MCSSEACVRLWYFTCVQTVVELAAGGLCDKTPCTFYIPATQVLSLLINVQQAFCFHIFLSWWLFLIICGHPKGTVLLPWTDQKKNSAKWNSDQSVIRQSLYVNKVHWLHFAVSQRENSGRNTLACECPTASKEHVSTFKVLASSLARYGRNSLHLVLGHLKTPRTPTESRKRPSGVEQPSVPSPSLPPPSAPLLLSSFSRGASSHVAVSLFRYQGRIVRIDCDRAQRLAARPPHPVSSVTRT